MDFSTQINKVLIAVDFSECSDQALYAGLSIAKKYDAEAYILHVAEPIRSFDLRKNRYVETHETIGRVEEAIRSRVNELWEKDGISAVDRRRVHVLVRGGHAPQEIVATAKAREVDLVLLGKLPTHGGVIGSTTERVTRNAPCSVFCVGPAKPAT